MLCPACDTRMICKDSRTDFEGTVRRYKCPKCNCEYCTEEVEITKKQFSTRANLVMKKKYKGDY